MIRYRRLAMHMTVAEFLGLERLAEVFRCEMCSAWLTLTGAERAMLKEET